MGGFEGGDEGGFWDIDILPTSMYKQNDKNAKQTSSAKFNIEKNDSGYSIKAHASVTIFQKVNGHKDDGTLTLLSRVMRVDKLYDTIRFEPCECEHFSIEGYEDIDVASNSIYKAYQALLAFTADSDIEEFFTRHKVILTKRIAPHAGLGGSASDAAAFIHLVKEVCNLILSTKELLAIASAVGPDLPFYIYNYSSANVSDGGALVEPFEEEALDLELHTPDIKCDKARVQNTFKEHHLADASLSCCTHWNTLDSKSILEKTADPSILNDLYPAALLAYEDLKRQSKEGWFFSGTGSSFFKVL